MHPNAPRSDIGTHTRRIACDKCPNCLTLACLSRLQKVASHPCLLQVGGWTLGGLGEIEGVRFEVDGHGWAGRRLWQDQHLEPKSSLISPNNNHNKQYNPAKKPSGSSSAANGKLSVAEEKVSERTHWLLCGSMRRQRQTRTPGGGDLDRVVTQTHTQIGEHQGLRAAGLREARGPARRAGAHGCVCRI